MANCNAHGRRNFVKVTASFPEPCRFVLESFREIYRYDAEARAQGMSAEQRLTFHQDHSKPVMDKLHAWLGAQFDERLAEPNSGLGQAISYLLNHWQKLTLFLEKAGVPLDNNIVERALKKAILHRNYVHLRLMWRGANRRCGERPDLRSVARRTAHNHNASRKARRRSLGW